MSLGDGIQKRRGLQEVTRRISSRTFRRRYRRTLGARSRVLGVVLADSRGRDLEEEGSLCFGQQFLLQRNIHSPWPCCCCPFLLVDSALGGKPVSAVSTVLSTLRMFGVGGK